MGWLVDVDKFMFAYYLGRTYSIAAGILFKAAGSGVLGET
jgi:hypothetical protein